MHRSLPLVCILDCISALCYTNQCFGALAFGPRCALALVCSLARAALIARVLGCICAFIKDAGWGLCCSLLSTLLLPLVEVPDPLNEVFLVPFTKSTQSGRHDAHSALSLQGI